MRDGAKRAKSERSNETDICRALRLALFVADTVEATLNGLQPKGMTLLELMW